jgi:hypothetical protein
MKRMSFYAKGNRSGNLLHIETDGCIVNIQVGLHDRDGRKVTSVRISPDNYAERGGRWVQDGSRIVQLLDGETGLPREQAPSARFGDPSNDPEPGLIAAARRWALDCEWLDSDDIADMSDAHIVAGVNQHYEGGWAAFAAAEDV